MYGMDISNIQRGIDLYEGKYEFCICKATEGKTLIDKSVSEYVKILESMGKRIGLYHYARPDINSTPELMREECINFIGTVRSLDMLNKAILVIDWEGAGTERRDLLEVLITGIRNEAGITPFVYCNTYVLRQLEIFLSDMEVPIWCAMWDYGKEKMVGETITQFANSIGSTWPIWQYTSNGKYPGYKGRIDLDYTRMTRDEWDRYSGKKKEVVSKDMAWAVNHGIFKGYNDGTYREDEPLTRGQAATLFRRFHDSIAEEIENRLDNLYPILPE